MPIDFHLPLNRDTYSGRSVDAAWFAAIQRRIDPTGTYVVDVGCGGGTYSSAWLELGANSVRGIDFSDQMLAAAKEHSAGALSARFLSRGRGRHWASNQQRRCGLPTSGTPPPD